MVLPLIPIYSLSSPSHFRSGMTIRFLSYEYPMLNLLHAKGITPSRTQSIYGKSVYSFIHESSYTGTSLSIVYLWRFTFLKIANGSFLLSLLSPLLYEYFKPKILWRYLLAFPKDIPFIVITNVKISPRLFSSELLIATDNVSFFTHIAVLLLPCGKAALHSVGYSCSP